MKKSKFVCLDISEVCKYKLVAEVNGVTFEKEFDNDVERCAYEDRLIDFCCVFLIGFRVSCYCKKSVNGFFKLIYVHSKKF